MSRPLKRLA